ncbi:MAG TPA: LysE family transporter, partial [Chlamydiales bacterium]|nr:LysE family transporter [Chlamydiales bacterium]
MDMNVFFKGLLLGLIIAVPVGPIGVLCIRKALRYGRLSGFFSGLGAATADLIYALTAAFGLGLVSDIFLKGHIWFQIAGGGFLCYLGCKTFFATGFEDHKTAPASTSLVSDFFSTFLLTLTNPLTILAFFAMFASFGLSGIAEEKKPN